MAAGRYCVKCGKSSVHRRSLGGAERMLSYVILARRDRCYRCGARSWVAIRGPRARRAILAASVFWLGAAAALVYLMMRPMPQDIATSVAIAAAVPAVVDPVIAVPPELSADRSVLSTDEQAVASELLAAVPEEAPADVAEAAEADNGAAVVGVHQLRAIDARWHQNRMEISLQLEEGQFPPHTLVFDKAAGGYVMDLPGQWQLPPQLRMSRSFTRSSLRQMNIGLHDEFLRIVFRLRGAATAAPAVSAEEGQLLLRFR